MNPTGPGTPYTLLFDDDHSAGPGLPNPFRLIYGGDWRLPAPPADRPYVFTNFVMAHDGRISFDEPGRAGGGDVSRHSPYDTWLMALIRARADAVITGSGTLRVARRHLWTPEQVFRADAPAFAALRVAEGRRPVPLLIIVSAGGELPSDAWALRGTIQPVLIATTARGAERARALLGDRTGVDYHIADNDHQVDMSALFGELRHTYGVSSLLSEGGPRLYGSLIAERLIDETFLTISPIVIGNRPLPAGPRPSLVEGTVFDPDTPPQIELISLRRQGSYLFQRSRFI